MNEQAPDEGGQAVLTGLPGDAVLPAPTTRAGRARRRSGWDVATDNVQFVVAVLSIALVVGAVLLVRDGLRRHGIPFTYGFLGQQAGFDVSEGLTVAWRDGVPGLFPSVAEDTNLQALVAGVYNTLLAAVVSVVLCTALGIVVGVARLSTNGLVRAWAFAYVEVIRNTPLLIQLVVWYFAVLLRLPPSTRAPVYLGSFLASQQGVFVPALRLAPGAGPFGLSLAVAAAALVAAWVLRRRRLAALVGLAIAALAVGTGVATAGFPVVVDRPVVGRFSVEGGIGFSAELAALVAALAVNTSAYIAEIVRGAIQSVARGQWEAAAALGVGRAETLRVVILPQAVRVIIPSLGNQYVSLAKSTSLGIAIGFPDLFNVYGTVANQSGRSLEGILVVMAIYLAISSVISMAVNAYNRRIMRRGAR